MPINVFGNSSSSHNNGNKIDTSIFVQKLYLRTNYKEANIEEDNNMKNQFKIKNLPCPQKNSDAVFKSYVDNLFNDPSIIKNIAHIDLNDRNITNARFIQVSQLLQKDSHLTAKLYVDNAIDEESLVRNNQDNYINKYNLINIKSITLNKQTENDKEVITKAYVNQFHQENERSRQDTEISFYDEEVDLVKNRQDSDLNDNNKTNLDSITVKWNPNSDNELANKKHLDDELDKDTILRFNQTPEKYLKVSVENDTYNLTKYDKIQIKDASIIKAPNKGGYLLQQWKLKCNVKNNNGKIQSFIRSTKTNSPIGDSGATNLPPIDDSFMYIETPSNNHGINVFVSWERTDITQITNKTFYSNRFSILTSDSHKAEFSYY